MKQYRATIFIIIATLALVSVLIIQVNWMVKTARIKENLFNEKADMVLARTAEALSGDTVTCKKIGDCMGDGSSSADETKLGKSEVQKIDSMLKHYMDFYNFHIGYSFKVLKHSPFMSKKAGSFSNYVLPQEELTNKKSLKDIAMANGFELNLVFPDKTKFIRAEMGPMFVSSVILVLIVLILFWRTIFSLTNEKKISEHTTDFLNNMTHEFKTPLTNIALSGKMILKNTGFNQNNKIGQYTDIIIKENEKLRLQVEQVLNMTALERGEIPLYKTHLNFHELVNDSIKSMQMQIENAEGHLNINLMADRFIFKGDKTHLTNVMCNLIDNAIKYSHRQPELLIETKNVDQSLIFVIADHGMGIGKEYRRKVFHKFFRIPTGDVHNVKGFGLGLAYVKKIIELHGGTIVLESEIQKGTTFKITFPDVEREI